MAEEIMNTSESTQEMSNDGVDYISAINELKQNSVDRKQYEKLQVENKRLLDALVDGKQIELPKKEEPNIPEMRKNLFGGDLSNLEYVDTALKLRTALIEKGEPDPFLPVGDNVNLTQDTIDKAEHVANVLQECVDFADGDSGIFTAELQRRTVDSNPIMGRRR
jgi:hypothetical protein